MRGVPAGVGSRAQVGLALLGLWVFTRASSAEAPDWQQEFLQPVDNPVAVEGIPSNMRHMVMLAVERNFNPDIKEDDPMLNPEIREQLRAQGFSMDGTFGGAVPVDKERVANMNRIRKAHRSETVPLADDFEPGQPELWHKVSGGMVSTECGSVEGEALCFDQGGERSVVTNPVRIIGGATVRFALMMAQTDEPRNVTLEFQTSGSRTWEKAAVFNPRTFSLPSPANPNSKLLESADGAAYNGFVFFSVALSRVADSGATSLRWIQDRPLGAAGAPPAGECRDAEMAAAKWGLDNVEVELGMVDRPAVILTASEDLGGAGDLGGGLLSVMAQLSEPVLAFDKLRIKADGGIVAAVSKLTGIGARKGEMYTISIVPDAGAGDVTVQILEGAGITKKGSRSMASNSITIMAPEVEDWKLSMIRKVSTSVIDLDATGMPPQDGSGRGGGAMSHKGLEELQARVEYLEREVVRLQQVEAELKHLKSSLLRQW